MIGVGVREEDVCDVLGGPVVGGEPVAELLLARRAGDELDLGTVHLTTVETWLCEKNPHHPGEADGSWTELRRAVLLAQS